MLTKSRAALSAAAGAGLIGAVLWSAGAYAARLDAGLDSTLWVGSPTVSHVSGEVHADAQLGLNFGVDLAGDGDVGAAANILVSVDLEQVKSLVVVTGLTAGCDAAPTLITCRLDPDSAEANYQSMTLKATDDAAPGSNGTIVVSTIWPDDTDSTDNKATIDVSVVTAASQSPTAQTTPTTSPTPGPAANADFVSEEVAPPVVIEPLPTMAPPTTPAPIDTTAPTATTASNAAPAITLTPTMSKPPRAVATRRPGIVQVNADGTRYVSYGGTAPEEPWASPVFIVALAASGAGLLSLLVFGVIGAVRANRPTHRPM